MNYSNASLAGFGSGCCTTTAIFVSFRTSIPGDFTDVSVNDYFGSVVRLFGSRFQRLLVYVPCIVSIFRQFRRLRSCFCSPLSFLTFVAQLAGSA